MNKFITFLLLASIFSGACMSGKAVQTAKGSSQVPVYVYSDQSEEPVVMNVDSSATDYYSPADTQVAATSTNAQAGSVTTTNTAGTQAVAAAGEGYQKTGTPYVIKGVTYYPLQTLPEDYEEYGIASWYGKAFHGKKTANGEIFDMYSFSAAHKTLPLPVYVNVTNLDNGKDVVVRVNDRGPFSKGRVIDLSYAAAEQLDMLQTGTARVKITLLSQSQNTLITDNIDESQTISSGNFAVQIGAFSNAENANRLAERFSNANVVSTVDSSGRSLYRVQLLGYGSVQIAEDAASQLSIEYPGAFVIRN